MTWLGACIMEAHNSQVMNFHSPTVIPSSALDKPSIMKRYHRRRTCSHTSPRHSLTMATLLDTQFVECQWWNDGWTVKTVVTWRSSASMIPAPGHHCTCWTCDLKKKVWNLTLNLQWLGLRTTMSLMSCLVVYMALRCQYLHFVRLSDNNNKSNVHSTSWHPWYPHSAAHSRIAHSNALTIYTYTSGRTWPFIFIHTNRFTHNYVHTTMQI